MAAQGSVGIRPTVRRKLAALAAFVLAVGTVVAQAPPVRAATGTISGAGVNWLVADDGTTTNGAPTGGECMYGSSGAGAMVEEADIPDQTDAFDFAVMAWVGGVQVGGDLAVAGQRATFSPTTVEGLTRQLSYEALTTAPVLRAVLTLQNTTSAPITTSVDYVTNLGSDDFSGFVKTTSSGDVAFTTADRWIVTDDSSEAAGDPAVTTVLYGPGSPPVTPTSVSQTVFDCAGPQGVLSTYSVTVPAGAARALLFFQRIDPTTAAATAAAPDFDTNSPASPLFAGLTAAELSTIVNWTNLTATTDTAHPSLPAVVRASTTRVLAGSLDPAPATVVTYEYGTRPLTPLFGDWDGNGSETPGIFQGGVFKLSDVHASNPDPAATFTFGDPRGFPVAGDFDGDGRDDVAVYRGGTWQVRYADDGASEVFSFGSGTWPATVPVAGDWDGDGIDGVGTYTLATGQWNLLQTASGTSTSAGSFVFWSGSNTSYPVVGDWDGDGDDTVGVRNNVAPYTWSLNNENDASAPEITLNFGIANDLPMSYR